MDSQKILCFLEIAKTQSFTKASENLYMSQSAVSRSIRSLEADLRMELFERNSKSTVLTPAGKIMADGLDGMLEDYERILKRARAAYNGYNSEIKIGVLQEFMLDVFPYVLNSFESLHPDISISLITEPIEMLREKLMDGGIDFVVGGYSDMNIQTLQHICIAKRRIGLAVSARHPLAESRAHLNLKDFEDDVFVTLPETAAPAMKNLMVRCERRGFTPKTVTAPDISTIMLWVETGRCVCILYENTALMGNPNISFLEMEDITPTRAAINWLDSGQRRAKQLFIDYIKDYNWPI